MCTSADSRDQRLRTSLLYSSGETNIVIDAGPDFRQQMLRTGIDHIDAIILTHEHNDHVIGMDDIRPFNFRSGRPMQVYGLPRVVNEIRKRFEYVFAEQIPGLPRIELIEITPADTITIGDVGVQMIEIMHRPLPILGFRFANFVYITDMKTIAPNELLKLEGTDWLVVNALHRRHHQAHMNLEEALEFVQEVNAKQTWFVHMSHHMGLHADVEKEIPQGVSLAFDQLVLELL